MDGVTNSDSLEVLLNMLADVEEKQHKLYDVYRRAAEVDEEMRILKNKEKVIRGLISMKVRV